MFLCMCSHSSQLQSSHSSTLGEGGDVATCITNVYVDTKSWMQTWSVASCSRRSKSSGHADETGQLKPLEISSTMCKKKEVWETKSVDHRDESTVLLEPILLGATHTGTIV